MAAVYPSVKTEWLNEEIEAEAETLLETVSAIRTAAAQLQLRPKGLRVWLCPHNAQWTEQLAWHVEVLAGIESVTFLPNGSPPENEQCLAAPLPSVTVHTSVQGANVDAIVRKTQKELNLAEASLNKLTARMAVAVYREKTPAKTQEMDGERCATLKDKVYALGHELAAFEKLLAKK